MTGGSPDARDDQRYSVGTESFLITLRSSEFAWVRAMEARLKLDLVRADRLASQMADGGRAEGSAHLLDVADHVGGDGGCHLSPEAPTFTTSWISRPRA